MPGSSTSRYANDPRVDKAITWGLTAFCGVALSVGAWFFSGLKTELKALSGVVGNLTTQVAVMAKQAEQLEEMRRSIQTVREEQLKRSKNVYLVEDLRHRIQAAEDRIKALER